MANFQLLLICLPMLAGAVAAGADDLPPLRRVWLPDGQLPPAWTAGASLQAVPLSEFEEVLKLAEAKQGRPTAPLQAAHYSARLAGDALVGEGEWRFAPSSGARRAELAPFGLAFRTPPRWLGAAGEASFAPLGAGLALAAPRNADALRFQWSLRGLKQGAELRFTLPLPPAPLAALEVALPRPLRLEAVDRAAGVLVAEEGLWQRRFRLPLPAGGAATALRLIVRPDAETAAQADAVQLRSHCLLEPGGAEIRWRVTWESRPVRRRELRFAVGPGLAIAGARLLLPEERPLDWSVEPGASAVLRIALPDGVGPADLELRGHWLQPLGSTPQPLPTLTPIGATQTAESATLRAPPEWSAEITAAGRPWPAPRVESGLAGDEEVWTAPSPAALAPAVPAHVKLMPRKPELEARQDTVWRFGAAGQTLETRTAWTAQRGRAAALRLALPPGWTLEDLKAEPAVRLRSHDLAPPAAEGAGQVLHLVLREALAPRTPFALALRLRRPGLPTPEAETLLPVCLPQPLDVSSFEGTLSLAADRARVGGAALPLRTARLQGFGRPILLPPPLALGPSGVAPTDGRVAYTAADAAGTLAVGPIPAELDAEALVEPKPASLAYRLRLRPAAGETREIRMRFAAPPPALAWTVRAGANRIESWRQIDDTNFTLTLAQPLAAPLELRGLGDWNANGETPLLWIANRGRIAAKLRLVRSLFSGTEPLLPSDNGGDCLYGPATKGVRLLAAPPDKMRTGASAMPLLLLALALGVGASARSQRGGRPLAGLALFAFAAAGLAAAAPNDEQRPVEVFLIPGRAGQAGASCLAPQDYWKKLRAAAQAASPAAGPIVFRSGTQTGKLEDAKFVWRFDAELEADGPQALPLPLGALKLTGVWLDEARTTAPPAAGVATLAVPGGRHRLRLEAEAAAAAPFLLQAQFPPMATQRLRLSLPAAGPTPMLDGPLGQVVCRDENGRVEIEAELGAVGAWTLSAGSASPSSPSWLGVHRLRRVDGLLRLASVFTLRNFPGPSDAWLDLPATLELWSAEAENGAVAPPEPGGRRVRIRLGAGVESRLTCEFLVRETALQAWAETLAAASSGPAGSWPCPAPAPFLLPGVGVGVGRHLALPSEARDLRWRGGPLPRGFAADGATTLFVESSPSPAITLEAAGELRLRPEGGDLLAALSFAGIDAACPSQMKLKLGQALAVGAVDGVGLRGWRQEGDRLTLLFDDAFAGARRLTVRARLAPLAEAEGVRRWALPQLEAAEAMAAPMHLLVHPSFGAGLELVEPGGWSLQPLALGAVRLTAARPANGVLAMAAAPLATPTATTTLGASTPEGCPFRIEVRPGGEPAALCRVRLRDWPAGVPLRLADADAPNLLFLKRDEQGWEVGLPALRLRSAWTLAGVAPAALDGQATLPTVEAINGRTAELRLRASELEPEISRPSTAEPWQVKVRP